MLRTVAIVMLVVPAAMALSVGSAHSESSPALDAVVIPLVALPSQHAILPDAETALLALLNQARRIRHLPPLSMDGGLRSAARAHSTNMASGGFVGHGSAGGGSFADRLGYVVRPGTLVGENVVIAQSVEQAHTAFVASNSHLRNILEPRFRRVGIGITRADGLGLFVTQDFSE